MRVSRRIGSSLCWLLVFTSGVAFGQPAPAPHTPQISGALLTSDELIADLKFLTELAGDPGVKAWKPLKATLDTFLDGIDTHRPIILDVLISPSDSEMRAHFPLQPAAPGKQLGAKFLANLGASGINTKRLTVGFYSVGGLFPGFLRIANGHCSIAENRNNLPVNLPDPTKGNVVAALLAKKCDVGLMVKNDKQAAEDQAARRKDFQKVKDNLTEG
ncbi:MAG TPA: hypothetical protein VK137_08075, partial [Planctomycetaceae bacterium]|nr:hypothetical protein [Planctomycetaceae bacterium]